MAELERALRLDPAPPASFQLLSGVVLYTARDYDRAVARLEAARKDLPVAEAAREFLAAAYGQLGDRKQAEEQSLSLLRLFPESNLAHYRYLYDYWRDAQRERVEHCTGLPPTITLPGPGMRLLRPRLRHAECAQRAIKRATRWGLLSFMGPAHR